MLEGLNPFRPLPWVTLCLWLNLKPFSFQSFQDISLHLLKYVRPLSTKGAAAFVLLPLICRVIASKSSAPSIGSRGCLLSAEVHQSLSLPEPCISLGGHAGAPKAVRQQQRDVTSCPRATGQLCRYPAFLSLHIILLFSKCFMASAPEEIQ